MTGFWTGGFDAHCQALRDEHELRLASLKETLANAATPDEKDAIQRQIRDEHKALQRRLAEAARACY